MNVYRKHGRNVTTHWDLTKWLVAHEEFSNQDKTFRGVLALAPDDMGTGRLPGDWARNFTARRNAGTIFYVVYSYRTPIAWYDDEINEWIIPDESYSSTTSRHQSSIRMAVSELEK
jgi:hypothetical protein